MGRPLSATLTSIFAGPDRKIDWTLDLTFPDASVFRFATAPLVIGGNQYGNDIESVGEIKQSLEAPIDRFRISLQNKDRVLGLHVATYWRKWRKAEVVLGRHYRGGEALSLTEWKTMFRGAVQKPNANDLQVWFDVIADTVSPGGIVTNRTLHPDCWFVYKDAKTCGYDGTEPSCNHKLKSAGGCDGKVTGSPGPAGNGHRYGGTEHRYNPDVSVPGTGGNTGGGGGGGGGINPPCPRLDQFVRVRGAAGSWEPKMVCFLEPDDEIWNPVARQFEGIESLEVVPDQDIWEIVTSNGAVGYSSSCHPVLWYQEHIGEAVHKFAAGDPVLSIVKDRFVNAKCLLAARTGEQGSVMRIVMKGKKIYCYGDDPAKMLACHNWKDPNDI